MSSIATIIAAATGSTGAATHTSVRVQPQAIALGFALIVETGGATPTISWKVQGAFDTDGIADGSANWFDLLMLPAASDTVAAIPLVIPSPNAVTGFVSAVYIAQSNLRFARRVRVVTSANTNVTYRVEFHQRVL